MFPASTTTRWTTASCIWNAIGKDAKGKGWYSFDHKGVHFVGLVNSAALEGMGKLGADQLEWLEADLKGRSSSTPLVLFAHLPLWTVYPELGLGYAGQRAGAELS